MRMRHRRVFLPNGMAKMTHRKNEKPKLELSKITAKVKWYNEKKGIGFINIDGNVKDIFLHFNRLKDFGRKTVIRGEIMVCLIKPAEKGHQVYKIISIGRLRC